MNLKKLLAPSHYFTKNHGNIKFNVSFDHGLIVTVLVPDPRF